MSDKTLGKMDIMRGERTVAALFASGKSGFRHPLRYVWRITGTEGESMGKGNDAGTGTGVHESAGIGAGECAVAGANSREHANANAGKKGADVKVLFSVPKKNFKRAVKRNLLRRRMREAYRLNRAALRNRAAETDKSVELALIYSSKEVHDFKTIEHGIKKILAEIGERL